MSQFSLASRHLCCLWLCLLLSCILPCLPSPGLGDGDCGRFVSLTSRLCSAGPTIPHSWSFEASGCKNKPSVLGVRCFSTLLPRGGHVNKKCTGSNTLQPRKARGSTSIDTCSRKVSFSPRKLCGRFCRRDQYVHSSLQGHRQSQRRFADTHTHTCHRSVNRLRFVLVCTSPSRRSLLLLGCCRSGSQFFFELAAAAMIYRQNSRRGVTQIQVAECRVLGFSCKCGKQRRSNKLACHILSSSMVVCCARGSRSTATFLHRPHEF